MVVAAIFDGKEQHDKPVKEQGFWERCLPDWLS